VVGWLIGKKVPKKFGTFFWLHKFKVGKFKVGASES
jgi:hypothetical protein